MAGASGGGKSEWLKNVVASLIRRNRPESRRRALVDPKLLTFVGLETSPPLLNPAIADISEALTFLESAVAEIDRRYEMLAVKRRKNLTEQHETGRKDFPFWVLVFDEFEDLILAGREEKKTFESIVARLSGKGRAAGTAGILQGGTVPARQPSEAPLWKPKVGDDLRHDRAMRFGLQNIFAMVSFKTIASRAWSATSFLSLRFCLTRRLTSDSPCGQPAAGYFAALSSSSSIRSRFASLTSRPPKRCFHLY